MMETERLILRPPEMRDADDFFDIFSDADTCRSDGGYEPLAKQHFVFEMVAADQQNRLFIVEKASLRMIGVIHLMDTDAAGEKEIGYVIHRDYRRRGYASEAMNALLAFLREQKACKVICTTYQFNIASQNLLEKLGFVETGRIEKQNPEWNERVYEKTLK